MTFSGASSYLRVFRFDVPFPDPLTLLVWERGEPLQDRHLALCARVLSLVMVEWVREQAREVGWDLPDGSWCVAIVCPALGPGSSHSPVRPATVADDDLAKALHAAHLSVVTGHLGDRHIVLWHDPPPPAEAETTLHRVLGDVASRQPFHVGIGGSYALSHIADSYREARATVDYLLRSKTPAVYHYSRLGLDRLLIELPHGDTLARFVEEWLGPLTRYDALHHTALVDTLQAYFSHAGNIPTTARTLFVHYNTVMNRLHHIETVLGRSIRDPNVALNLQVALKAAPLLAAPSHEAETFGTSETFSDESSST